MGVRVLSSDLQWQSVALSLAKQAAENNEVPVGAVIVLNDQIIGMGHNQPIATNDPTAHAEIVALRQAAKLIGNYRLIEACMYVTLEPCAMCAGSLLHARIKRLVFGAYDKKAGAVSSQLKLLDHAHNHQVTWEGGLLANEAATLLQTFFQARR